LSDDTHTIELRPCGYEAACEVKQCKARAIIIARSADAGGRPIRQYALCAPHAEWIAEREKGMGRQIVRREVASGWDRQKG
jgi:hypothetical protein